ncbi:helix-hairpin-helix domain-containing protein [Peribacillus frigoritolerans]|uniref:helix-hairpin-helix domain-containing protein n=1 Tax=Peribacillus frigoritolerans TaxID=450367 RepID=UPI0022308FDB|nr:helix-hairpin-helix domain-containing protein [Peribacillus frigoritolerans]MDM5313276.1 helix-hairpin-helix domain-containing protein [Peribacillus frigoritolerans]UZD45412.1 helix-hairpin-helix domain-containing protein [Peribacillus frigoritolerans]WHX60443.1 helix-hairpin-helix domain-containing protein [Peribacillus frigoritolerans]
MEGILKRKMTMITVAMAFVAGGIYFFSQKGEDPADTEDIFSVTAKEAEMDQSVNESAAEPEIIKVDVKGAVKSPGIFTAQAGDRVIDLISSAGSFTEKADTDKVNFAQIIEDQMVIYVPEIGEEDKGNLENIQVGTSGDAVTKGTSGGLVNLNTATQEDLQTLTGIGPSKADAILEYRETVGKFKEVDELKQVTGIGDKTFERLRDSISVK